MRFEFDPEKSAANLEKHGIDFVEAQQLWNDRRALRTPSYYPAELRTLLTAALHDKLSTVVYTKRQNAVRIISVRRARDKEAREYGAQAYPS